MTCLSEDMTFKPVQLELFPDIVNPGGSLGGLTDLRAISNGCEGGLTPRPERGSIPLTMTQKDLIGTPFGTNPELWFTDSRVEGPAIVTALSEGEWTILQKEESERDYENASPDYVFSGFSGSFLFIPKDHRLECKKGGMVSGYTLDKDEVNALLTK